MFQSTSLKNLTHITHGFFGSYAPWDPSETMTFRRDISTMAPLCLKSWDFAIKSLKLPSRDALNVPRLLHGTHAVHVSHQSKKPLLSVGDAVITTVPNVGMGVTMADCGALLIASRQYPVIAAIHAGWRGALQGIVPKTLQRLKNMGVPMSSLVVAIGPCLGVPHFPLGRPWCDLFKDRYGYAASFFHPGPQKKHFDLGGFLAFQCAMVGVQMIESFDHDTYTHPHCHSYRRGCHHGKKSGLMLAAIKICSYA